MTFVGGVISAALGFLFIVVITRGLRAGGAGVFFEALALFSILNNTAELGADTGLVRFIPRFRATRRTQDVRGALVAGLVPVFAIGVLLAGALFIFAPWLAGVFITRHDPQQAVTLWRILAVALPFSTVSTVALAATRGFGTMIPYVAISDVAKPLLRPALALAVLAGGWGTLALGVSYAIPIVVGFIAACWWLAVLLRRTERTDLVEPGPPRPMREVAGEFWRFAAPRGLATVFSVGVFRLDVLLLGALATTREAGIYAASTRYLAVGGFALQAILLVIAPQVSAMLATRDDSRAGAVFATSTWWLVASSWPLYLVLAAFAPVFLSIFGREFVAGQHVLMILSLAMLVNLATGPVNAVLLMAGKSSWNLLNTLASLALNIGLNLWLIPRMGPTGAAIAWAASIVVNNIAALVEVKMLLGLHPLGFGFYLVSLGALVCYGGLGIAARLVLDESVAALISYGVVATAAYGALVWTFRDRLHISFLREGLRIRNSRAAARAEAAQPSWAEEPGPAEDDSTAGLGFRSPTAEEGATRVDAQQRDGNRERQEMWETRWRKREGADFHWYLSEPPPQLRELMGKGGLPPGAAVDVGCGPGIVSNFLAEYFPLSIGLDIAPTAVMEAKERAEGEGADARYLVAEAPRLPFREGRFALVFDRGCMQAIPREEWPEYLRVVEGLLVSGGYLQLFVSKNARDVGDKPGLRKIKKRLRRLVKGTGQDARQRDVHARFEFESHVQAILPPSMQTLSVEHFPVKMGNQAVRIFTHALIKKL